MASTFPTVNWFCLVLLCGRAGRLTAQNGGSRRGQGGKLWAGARGYACSDCCEGGPDGDTSLMSNDKSIVPALSAAKLAYQCNGTVPPCKLHWYHGKNCYKITNAPFSAGVTGYAARAAKLGYRTVAAASGTTANVLQYGLMLGFSPDELVLLRLVLPPLLRPPPPTGAQHKADRHKVDSLQD